MNITKDQKVKFINNMQRIREKLHKRKKKNLVYLEPRYDEVYFDGLKWLNSMESEHSQ